MLHLRYVQLFGYEIEFGYLLWRLYDGTFPPDV